MKTKYRFNVKPEDCRYIVNEEKRKVICLIENTKYSFLNFANNNFVLAPECFDNPWGRIYTNVWGHLVMPNRFCGIATCNENDEWNEETGRLIAYSRAKDKLNKSFFKRANYFVNTVDKHLNDAVDVLNRLGDRLEISTERRHQKIINTVGEE